MKNIQESILNEASKITYRVKFIDFDEGVDLTIDKSIQREFENFLDNEEGNIFEHADGGTIEY